jgi:hypothetical protein
MKHLAPYWTSAKVNAAELDRMRDALAQLQLQGIHPDTAAAQFPLITAKLSAKEVTELKRGFPRQGFVQEIDALDAEAKDFAAQLSGKNAAIPSQAWRLIMSARPEVVLAVVFSTKSATLQSRFKSFFTEWPQARQKMPYTLMQEMRIVPELPDYDQLLEKLFFELMDGKLTTPEEMKAFLEPYSPPAPPPPVSVRRPRAVRKEARPSKARVKRPKGEGVDPDNFESGSSTLADPVAEAAPPPSAPAAAPKTPARALPPAPSAKTIATKPPAKVPATPPAAAPKASVKAAAKKTPPVKGSIAKKPLVTAKKLPAKTVAKGTAKKAAVPVKAAQASKSGLKAPTKKIVAKAPAKAAKKPAPPVKSKALPAKAKKAAKKMVKKR